MSDDLRERLARAIANFWRSYAPVPLDDDLADALLPLIREYAERESDARAEANHLTGYRQGRRDAFRDALRLLETGALIPSLAQWLISQIDGARADLRDQP